MIRHPAANEHVDTSNAAVDSSDQSHQGSQTDFVLHLTTQDNQRHGDGGASDTLHGTSDEQEVNIWRESRQNAAQCHHRQHDQQDTTTTHNVGEPRQEEAAHCAAGEERRLGQADGSFVSVQLARHGGQHRREHGCVQLEGECRGQQHEHQQGEATGTLINRVLHGGRR